MFRGEVNGGTIVLGVQERDGEAIPDSLTAKQITQYRKALHDGAHNKNTVNRDLLGPADVEPVTLGSMQLLVVHIRRADRTDRPVHVSLTPFGSTYKRAYEGDYRCDDAEVRRMLADADPTPNDQRILQGYGFADFDTQSLVQYRQRMLAAKGDHPWLALADREFLLQLGGWRIDRTNRRKAPPSLACSCSGNT